MQTRNSTRAAAALFFASLLGAADVSHAAESAGRLFPEGGNGGGIERTINQLSALFLVLPGIPLVAVAAEGALGERDVRLSKGWTIASYIFSGLGIATGGAVIAADPGNAKSIISGAILVGLGAFDLGLTLYRNRSGNKPGGDVSLKPLAGFDARGGTFAGVGITFGGF